MPHGDFWRGLLTLSSVCFTVYSLLPSWNISWNFLQYFLIPHPTKPSHSAGEICLIGTNGPATAKSIVFPVASESWVALCKTWTIWEKRLTESGTAGPANCIFFCSLILWNTHEALSYLRRKYRRNPERQGRRSPWSHPNFCLVLRGRSARFSWKGQKVTISLVYSRPGAHSSWDPFRCLTLVFHGGTESLWTLLCSWEGEEVRIYFFIKVY